MKQTNKKYISKEMAMMAALTTESMLLHENQDAMLYWNAEMKYYCILNYSPSANLIEEYPNYECSRLKTSERDSAGKIETALYFDYKD